MFPNYCLCYYLPVCHLICLCSCVTVYVLQCVTIWETRGVTSSDHNAPLHHLACPAPVAFVENPDQTMLQCVTVCYNLLQCVTMCYNVFQCVSLCYNVLQCVTMCCNVLQCVTMCSNVLQYGRHVVLQAAITMHRLHHPACPAPASGLCGKPRADTVLQLTMPLWNQF